jgi:predicted metalloprotease with PDZ domain
VSPVPARRAARGTDPIVYRIAPSDPHAHLFSVAMTIAEPAPEGQRVALPAWIPGSYMIREFARHVVALSARDARGALRVDKLDKHTWRVAPSPGPVVVEYTVYAWDLSVRAAHLDATHGFANPTSVCLRAIGQESRPCTVDLEPPPASVARGWRVATTLPEAGARRGGFGRYRAADYDALADHPIEMGTFELARFEAGGAEHEIAVTGRSDVDLDRLARDLAPVCAAQAALFEPRSKRAPFDRYLFLTTAVGDGYGGLEHRDSTALLCGRNDLPWRGMAVAGDGYRTFLGLASHEYFHAWHVKRIKPAAFVPYDFDRETCTRLLWVFEGFTSYYDDLMLVRAGVVSRADYLKSLARTICLVQRAPGRTVQSVADSSFDAWIKYYRQDENSPNAIVSYYAKGALVALSIDLAVRARTGGRASLDDAMRAMWTRYGRDFYAPDGGPGPRQSGLAEDAFPGLLREATGVSLGPQLSRWVDGTDELPLARLLAPFGVTLTLAAADASPSLGVRTATRGADLAIATAYSGGAAQRAGLSAGDTIVAVDGLRVDEKSLKALLARRRPGDVVAIHAFRRDELMRFEATLDTPSRSEARLVEAPGDNALRRGWLGAASDPIEAAARPRTGARPSRAARCRSGSRSSAGRR